MCVCEFNQVLGESTGPRGGYFQGGVLVDLRSRAHTAQPEVKPTCALELTPARASLALSRSLLYVRTGVFLGPETAAIKSLKRRIFVTTRFFSPQSLVDIYKKQF